MSGLDLHVERDGPPGAPALLLLHGFTGSTRTWDDLRQALRDDCHILALDLPGHGQSPVPDDPAAYALPSVAHDIARALDREGISRCAVLGYSMGGRQALHFALACPERVSSLVLESTSPGIADPAERAQRRRRDHEVADFIEREGVAAFVDMWERLPLWTTQASLPEAVKAKQRAIRLSHSAKGLANSLRGAGQGEDASCMPSLAELHGPLAMIVGARDGAYVEHARRMLTAVRNTSGEAALIEVSDAGHAVHVEQPTPYAAAIRKLIGR